MVDGYLNVPTAIDAGWTDVAKAIGLGAAGVGGSIAAAVPDAAMFATAWILGIWFIPIMDDRSVFGVYNETPWPMIADLFAEATRYASIRHIRNIFGEELDTEEPSTRLAAAHLRYAEVYKDVKTVACTNILTDEIGNWFQMGRRQKASTALIASIRLKKPHMLHTDLFQTLRKMSKIEGELHPAFEYTSTPATRE